MQLCVHDVRKTFYQLCTAPGSCIEINLGPNVRVRSAAFLVVLNVSTVRQRYQNVGCIRQLVSATNHFATTYQAQVENNMSQIFHGLLKKTAFCIGCVWTTSWKQAITVLLKFVLFRSGIDAMILDVQTHNTILLRQIVIWKTQVFWMVVWHVQGYLI